MILWINQQSWCNGAIASAGGSAAMVKRLQYASWSGPADTARLLGLLLGRLDPDRPTEGTLPTVVEEAARIPVGDNGSGTSAVPPPQPPKAPYSSHWYVARASAERQADDFLREPGSPVVLVGPREIGKTYLLGHLLETHCQDGDRQVSINLDLVDDEVLESQDALFRELAFNMADDLDLDEAEVDEAWARKKRRPPGTKLRHFMEHSVLSALEGRLFLALDRADAIASIDSAVGLFQELRRWAELSGRREPWDRLRMLLVISTEPGRLHHNLKNSPFNISLPIRLDDLEREQLEEMARRYGVVPASEEIAALMELVGGHPYLARKVLYQAAKDNKPIPELLHEATASQGLFADHLRSRMLKVQRDSTLVAAVRQVIHGNRNAVDAEVAHDLLSCGLIAGDPGGYQMRYKLYDIYFREWLRQ